LFPRAFPLNNLCSLFFFPLSSLTFPARDVTTDSSL
jgi:hypothetical protein